MKIEAAQRLKAAGPPNSLKNTIMRGLTSAGHKVDRQGDSVFVVHARFNEVAEVLEALGWEHAAKYSEYTKRGEEYSIAYTTSGDATKLEFNYDA